MCRRGVLVALVVGLVLVVVSSLHAGDVAQETPIGSFTVGPGSTDASNRTLVPTVELTPEMQVQAQKQLDELRATAAPLSRAVFWIDDFEDGDLVGWTGPEPTSYVSVDYIGANSTARSLRIIGRSSHFGGMSYDMGPSTPTGLNVYLRPGSTSVNDTYFVASDAASYGFVGAIFLRAAATGRLIAVSDVDYDCGPYNANQWYDVSFNIDWQCEVYDVYINGALKQYSVPLRQYFDVTPDNIQYIDVYNYETSTAWWDQIWVSTPGVSPLIFSNGFERGSTCGWSATVG